MTLANVYRLLGIRRTEVDVRELKRLVKAALVAAHRMNDAGRMRQLSQAKERLRGINRHNRCPCGVPIASTARTCTMHRRPHPLELDA